MGCHTWFYKRENLSLEDAIKKAVSKLEQANDSAYKYLNTQDYTLFSKEELDLWVNYNNRLLSWIKRGWITTSCYDILQEGIYIKEKNAYYVDADLHDVFRIGGYPNDMLFSLQETLNFIEKNKEGSGEKYYIHSFCQNWQQALEKFWSDYPDGHIHFG